MLYISTGYYNSIALFFVYCCILYFYVCLYSSFLYFLYLSSHRPRPAGSSWVQFWVRRLIYFGFIYRREGSRGSERHLQSSPEKQHTHTTVWIWYDLWRSDGNVVCFCLFKAREEMVVLPHASEVKLDCGFWMESDDVIFEEKKTVFLFFQISTFHRY